MAVSRDEVSIFLESCPCPGNLATVVKETQSFIARQQARKRQVVLITSGGTCVPLERQPVRYLDNFSTGRRGATSAEWFLRKGYAVIFLHRDTSLLPFHRHFTGRDFLASLSVDGTHSIKVSVCGERGGKLVSVLSLHQEVQKEASLLQVPYSTLFDYAHLLKAISLSLQSLGSAAMLYLAAAVSDFFLPLSEMSEHKLPSSERLRLIFSNTPKLLTTLRREWAPHAFTVTFKLETDAMLLVPHARAALEKYNHQVVVGNILQTRNTTVTMVTKKGAEPLHLATGSDEIEAQIVDWLVTMHSQWMSGTDSQT